MKLPAVLVAVLLALPAAAFSDPPPGYRLVDSVAASVNGEVIFLSEVVREACYYRCGMVPGQAAGEISLAGVREKLIADALVLQEQKKLGLGIVDNAAVAAAAAEVLSRREKCALPCAKGVTGADARDLATRRLLVRDFLSKRVGVFIEVNGEEVKQEIERLRSRGGADAEDLAEEKVRKSLYEQKAASEIRNWFTRATSKSRIVLSPMVEK
ncbi:MAG: hypothetical protein HZA60_05350 [Deltaproteobacteria bacterium]|nr:hypothetical protein [Deltaproteobacteria bacterium]